MTNLRDKIAAIIWHDRQGQNTPESVADAILALPEIADLQKKLAEVERQHALDVIDAVNAQDRLEILAEFYVLKRAECEAAEAALKAMETKHD